MDGGIGGITYDEFKIAIESYENSKRPKIFVYNNKTNEEQSCPEITNIKERINLCHQYYTDYRDLRDLKQQVEHDYIKEFVIPSLNKSRRL